MSLGCHKEGMLCDFTHLHDASVGRETGQMQTIFGEDSTIIIVDLIAVAVPLINCLLAVKLEGFGSPVQHAGIRAQSQRAADILNAVLVGHERDDGMGGVGVKLNAVRIIVADDIACVLYKTDEEGYALLKAFGLPFKDAKK